MGAIPSDLDGVANVRPGRRGGGMVAYRDDWRHLGGAGFDWWIFASFIGVYKYHVQLFRGSFLGCDQLCSSSSDI